jgi:predicted DNA-binding transcriptional regulator AlpA
VRERRLAGFKEVTGLLGVSTRTATRYTSLPDFPKPVARLAMGPIWDADEVAEWGRRHGPVRRGRPALRSQD